MNEQHADKFKTASDEIEIEYKVQGKDWTPKKFRNGREFEAWYDKMHKKPGFEINEESVEGHSEEYLRSLMASENYGLTADDDKAARFEQGKPADPTENMTDEDAAEWQANTEQYGDKFKTAVTYRTMPRSTRPSFGNWRPPRSCSPRCPSSGSRPTGRGSASSKRPPRLLAGDRLMPILSTKCRWQKMWSLAG